MTAVWRQETVACLLLGVEVRARECLRRVPLRASIRRAPAAQKTENNPAFWRTKPLPPPRSHPASALATQCTLSPTFCLLFPVALLLVQLTRYGHYVRLATRSSCSLRSLLWYDGYKFRRFYNLYLVSFFIISPISNRPIILQLQAFRFFAVGTTPSSFHAFFPLVLVAFQIFENSNNAFRFPLSASRSHLNLPPAFEAGNHSRLPLGSTPSTPEAEREAIKIDQECLDLDAVVFGGEGSGVAEGLGEGFAEDLDLAEARCLVPGSGL